MLKSFIVVEKGLVEDAIYFLKDRLKIGRSPDNDIYLSDPEISRQHAMVLLEDGHTVVRDLESYNGTFLSGKRIQKTRLYHGDRFQCGTITLRFMQKDIALDDSNLTDTRQIPREVYIAETESSESRRRSRRLMEAISNIPLFSGLDNHGIAAISRVAKLAVIDQDDIIMRQGDRANSMYIILDGSVEVFTYDNSGDVVPLAVLTANQFFGEMSFLTGAPRAATIQALENTLLCEIRFSVMRDIIRRWPSIKYTLNKYYHERFCDIEEKKKTAGLEERRAEPRFNIKLEVYFTFADPDADPEDTLEEEEFSGFTRDISVSGMQIIARDPSLIDLTAGSFIRITAILPPPWEPVTCPGIVKNVLEGVNDQCCISIAFSDMDPDHASRLEQFLFEDEDLFMDE